MCTQSEAFIGQVERGERNIALSNLKKLADAFGLSLSEMVHLSKTKPTDSLIDPLKLGRVPSALVFRGHVTHSADGQLLLAENVY